MIHSLAWRKSPDRLATAQEILANPGTLAMLAVLELDHPAKNIPKVTDGFGATEQLGVIRGFEMCLSMFRELGRPAPMPVSDIPSTWGSQVTAEEIEIKK